MRILETAAFTTFDHEPIDTGIHRLQRRVQAGHDVEYSQPRGLQLRGITLRVTG